MCKTSFILWSSICQKLTGAWKPSTGSWSWKWAWKLKSTPLKAWIYNLEKPVCRFVGPSTKFVSVIYLGGFWSRAPARSWFLRWFWTSIAFPAVKFRRSSLLPVRIVGSYLFWQLRKLGKSCENKRMLNLIKKYFRVPNKTEGNSILFWGVFPPTCPYSELIKFYENFLPMYIRPELSKSNLNTK